VPVKPFRVALFTVLITSAPFTLGVLIVTLLFTIVPDLKSKPVFGTVGAGVLNGELGN
jgi:hypothetical protein